MRVRTAIGVGVMWSALALVAVSAQEPKGVATTAEEFEAKLGYQTGTVHLSGGMATITLPEEFRFLDVEGAKRLLVDAWGNPERSAEGVLGMMVPADVSPLEAGGWGIVITYDDDGFVNDDDAAKMDFDKLLGEMQEGAREVNEAREKEGQPPVDLIGWAEPPHYDAEAHKLYWAKELAFGDSPTHTLNYNIRILGRRGVLVLNAVSSIDQLEDIRSQTQNVLAAVSFNEGHRYSDYLPGKDKAATYGVAGLIAGATAAKAGFFKAIWIGLLAFKKVLAGAAVAFFAMLKRLFSRKETAEAA
jgi:uncharacterized membrane-anchored protein